MKRNTAKRITAALLCFIMIFSCTEGAFAASKSDTKEITITMTGDLMCDTKYQQYLYDEDKGTFEFDATFKYVKKIFNDSDFTVGNLETCVASGYKLSRDRHYRNGEPYMNAPKKYLRALKRAGFDGLILANNHILDTDLTGAKRTIDAIEEAGFKHTGMYRSSSDKRYFILKKNGIKVAFLAYATHYNYNDYKLSSKTQTAVLGRFADSRVKADVKAAKKAGADYIVAYMHAGTEYTYAVNSQQKEIARSLARNGVDFIVGSHPHVLQRASYIQTGSRKVPVIFSMGNFTGKLRRAKTRETAILKITVQKTSSGKVSLKKKEYIPVYMSTKWSGEKMVLIPEGYKAGTKKSRDMLEGHFSKINKIIYNK